MQIEVKFPDGRRMWPARLEQAGRDEAGQPRFEPVPVEHAGWSFARAGSFHRGVWKALRLQTM